MSEGFPIRGIIEGFYGRPWTHAQRLDMIEFIGGLGMNTFVYGPKDDAHLRRAWRDPYAPHELVVLSELVAQCERFGITFVYALSPGLSMRYSSENDLALLIEKYAQVASLGVRGFALLLDDIPPLLQHAADRDRFDRLVQAQIELIGRVHSQLGGSLAIAPTVYWGRGDEEYIAELGRGLDPVIDLFWTGRAICSPELEAVDAERFVASTGHQPLYWDNFPVNDVAMTHELHLGPYLGREPALLGHSRGVIANAMPYAESSKIAFSSIADFLRDPAGFDAEASWEAGLRSVAGSRYEAVREFADAMRGSALCADDAPRLARVIERFAFEYDFGDRAAAITAIAGEAVHLRSVADELLTAQSPFTSEARPWIEQFDRGADAIALVAGLLERGPLDAPARAQVMSALTELRSHRLRVFGDLVDMFLSDQAQEFERD